MQKGTCHCGKVAFTVASSLDRAVRCNCSYCVRRGWITGYATTDEFELLSGENELRAYQFGNKTATNYFCGNCGIHTHFYGTYGGRTHYAFSIACLDDVDIDNLNVEHIDGKSF